MTSPKQYIYAELIYHGFLMLRAQQSMAAHASWWWLFKHRRTVLGQGYALADLLHNLHHSILVPEFTDNDLGFVNHAIPVYIKQVRGNVDPHLAGLLLAFHEAVPPDQKHRLTWHPSDELRSLTSRGRPAEADGASEDQ
jgi:hypothetical protein